MFYPSTLDALDPSQQKLALFFEELRGLPKVGPEGYSSRHKILLAITLNLVQESHSVNANCQQGESLYEIFRPLMISRSHN